MGFDEAVKKGLACPYCGKVTELKHTKNFYAGKCDDGWVYVCADCDAYSLCKKGTLISMGSISSKDVKQHRMIAIAYKNALANAKMKKDSTIDAYRANYLISGWASKELGIPPASLNIYQMQLDELKKFISLMEKYVPVSNLIK